MLSHRGYDEDLFNFDFCFAAKSVVIDIKCQCGNKFKEKIDIIAPNFESDSVAKSIESEDYDLECSRCGCQYRFNANNSFWGGTIEYDNNTKNYDEFEISYKDFELV